MGRKEKTGHQSDSPEVSFEGCTGVSILPDVIQSEAVLQAEGKPVLSEAKDLYTPAPAQLLRCAQNNNVVK
jgi:hypothetical protein